MPVRRVDTGSGHHYETADGDQVPGVTSIISAGVPKPALVPWAAKTAAGYAVDRWDDLGQLPPSERLDRIKKEWRGVRDRAAVRGTRVHALGEALAHGQQVDVPDELLPYVEPYARLLDEFAVKPVVTEAVVSSDEPFYAGTLDMIADLHDGTRWLLDIKTSGSGVWPETGLQLSAYRWSTSLYAPDGTECEMEDVDRAGVLWLPGDGTAGLIPLESGPDVFDAFEGAYRVWAWSKRRKGELVGRALTAPVVVKEAS